MPSNLATNSAHSGSIAIASDLMQVAGLAKRVREFMAAQHVSASDANEIEICVVEAVNNAIEHGYNFELGHQVEVELVVAGDSLVIEMRDWGEPFDPVVLAKAKRPSFDAMDIDTLPERGMGLGIIKEVMTKVEHQRRDGANVLIMSKKLQPDPVP